MIKKHNNIRFWIHRAKRPIQNLIKTQQANPNFLLNNQAEYDIVMQEGLMSLRHYRPLKESTLSLESGVIPVQSIYHSLPLVMIPPLGVYAWIFDLIPERSLVKFMLAHGYNVYLIDWGSPSFADVDVALENYVLHWMPLALQAVHIHSQQKELSLLGYCMGGLLALMYLGIEKNEQVRNLITLASPIDFHNNGLIGRILSQFAVPGAKTSNLINAQIAKLNKTHLHINGTLLSSLFKLTNPLATVFNHFQLIRHLNDTDLINRRLSIGQWFNNMADCPGLTTQQMIEKFVLGNQLALNTLSIGTQQVDVESIHCNLLSLAGSNDSLVKVSSAKSLMQLVNSADKRFTVVNAGHAGIFGGSRAPKLAWKMCEDWLSVRSNGESTNIKLAKDA